MYVGYYSRGRPATRRKPDVKRRLSSVLMTKAAGLGTLECLTNHRHHRQEVLVRRSATFGTAEFADHTAMVDLAESGTDGGL